MDYKKFHRTNAIINLTGNAIAVVWAIVNLFRAECFDIGPTIPILIAGILRNSHDVMLPLENGYEKESYYESLKTSYSDSRTLRIISAVCFCTSWVLVSIRIYVL